MQKEEELEVVEVEGEVEDLDVLVTEAVSVLQ